MLPLEVAATTAEQPVLLLIGSDLGEAEQAHAEEMLEGLDLVSPVAEAQAVIE